MDASFNRIAAVVLLALEVAIPAPARAVSYYPLYHPQLGDETAAPAGSVMYLFFSGTEVEHRSLREGDILDVSRINRSCEAAVVGKIRVLAVLGETYLKTEVLEGRIQVGDIARKDGFSCLVIPAEPCPR